MSEVSGKIYVKGGVLSPGELRRIVGAVQYFGTENIHIGNRQDILFKADKKYTSEIAKRIGSSQYHYEIEEFAHSNIVTSFPAKNIYHSTPWLTEDLYLEILSSFNYSPKLKINIVDPCQQLVPLFSGELNFVASSNDNYWYLFLRMEGATKPVMWPVLVDGNEISAMAEAIEGFVATKRKMSLITLESYIYNLRTWNFQIITSEFKLTPSRLFNYEGFHAIGDKYWLGIYKRDNSFPVNFIENLCILCAQTNIGSINLTPWNSFIIKNIQEKDIPLWENLLGKFGVNTGHSHLELNWQLPELDEHAVKVKNYIFRAFEKTGLRTEGLIFGLSDESHDLASSIFITRRSALIFNKFRMFTTYGVRYKKNFNPNSWEVISFADGLKKRNLPNILSYVAGLYYKGLTQDIAAEDASVKESVAYESEVSEKKKEVYQCAHCLSIYDPAFGDPFHAVVAGIPFADLPDNYSCSLCEAPKADFTPVLMETLVVK